MTKREPRSLTTARGLFLVMSIVWAAMTFIWLATHHQWAHDATYYAGLAWVILAYWIIVRTWPEK